MKFRLLNIIPLLLAAALLFCACGSEAGTALTTDDPGPSVTILPPPPTPVSTVPPAAAQPVPSAAPSATPDPLPAVKLDPVHCAADSRTDAEARSRAVLSPHGEKEPSRRGLCGGEHHLLHRLRRQLPPL